jgi:hypothetical protein
VTLDRAPILGSPFRCYLSSDFVRAPLSLSASSVSYAEKHAKNAAGAPAKSREVAVPFASPRPSACMVDGQMLVLSTALSTPTAKTRWPSMHTCQFKSAFAHENVYIGQHAPACRWRSCLLPSHDLEARHVLVGGPSSVYVLSQSGGVGQPIDGISCAEVIGGGAWRPPQSFISLLPNGRTPEAIDGFAAVYVPAVDGCRQPLRSAPKVSIAPTGDDEEDGGSPGGKSQPAGGGDASDDGGGEAVQMMDLPPCLWLVGGARSDGLFSTIDIYNIEEERWLGDPLEHEPDAEAPAPVTNGACAVVPAGKGGSYDIWLFGGRNAGGLSDELWALDVQSLGWRLLESGGMPPEAREYHSLTRVLSRFLLAFGGITAEASPVTSVSLFDLQTCTWSIHEPAVPVPRFGHVAGYAAGQLYIFGGVSDTEPSNEMLCIDCDATFPQTAALQFDGDPSKVVTVKPSASLNALLDKFTVECWVAPSSFPPNAPAVVKADGGCKIGFGLVALDEAAARKYVAIDKEKVKEGGAKERNPWENSLAEAERLPTMAFFVNGLKKETCALIHVTPGEWSHVAATFDGKNLITYTNGKRSDYVVPDPPLEEFLHTQGELYIGGIPGKLAWDGLVDAVRVWNKDLAWETIRENMNETLLGAEQPHLVGQWSCNEGAGDLCVDSSSRANHGSLVNADGNSPVTRVMCTRDHVEPTKTSSEKYVEENFERLRTWRIEFEKRVGREVTSADLLLADESIRKTARRLGLLP